MTTRLSVPVAVVLDSDPEVGRMVEQWLRPRGWTVFVTFDPVDATAHVGLLRELMTVVVTDASNPELSADMVVGHARRFAPALGVLCISQVPVTLEGVNCIHLGKSFRAEELARAARSLIPPGTTYQIFEELEGT